MNKWQTETLVDPVRSDLVWLSLRGQLIRASSKFAFVSVADAVASIWPRGRRWRSRGLIVEMLANF